MEIDFFEKEAKKAQKRFNQFFGTQVICNIEERQTLILAVCWLSVLNRRIKENAENTELLKEFINNRNKLNQYFDRKERREFDEPVSDDTSNGGQGSGSMLQLWECLQSGAAEGRRRLERFRV